VAYAENDDCTVCVCPTCPTSNCSPACGPGEECCPLGATSGFRCFNADAGCPLAN
jgi:hypothetical protein